MNIGHYTLNISMILYLIMYFPQLYHNRSERLVDLSLHFHNLLTLYYIMDLIYGFGLLMPWQYRLVSTIGLICLIIQQIQLRRIHRKRRYFVFSAFGLCLFGAFGIFSVLYQFPKNFFIDLGYVSQAVALFYRFPQIYKNVGSMAALSLSMGYLTLMFFCAMCDNVSAWFLHWPAPSKLGAIISILLSGTLIIQWLLVKRKNNHEAHDSIIETISETECA